MAVLKPFRGLRPPKKFVQKIACPPYDVVSTEEARAYAAGNEKCFFHISRPEIGLPAGTDEHSDEVYELGRGNLRKFREKNWLKQEPKPVFYVYREKMGAHSQVGVVGLASLAEYEQGLIKKHEHTRPDKENDRTRHIHALEGNDEPVFLIYRADAQIDSLVATVTQTSPKYDFVSEDGVSHTFWMVGGRANGKLMEAFEQVPALYIADGHHRSAAAARVRKLYNAKDPGSYDFFLATVFPHNQTRILDYNRVVKDLNGLPASVFLETLGRAFSVESTQEKKPSELHQFGMYLESKWYRLTAKPGTFPETPIGVLDVSILQENILRTILGVGDVRTDPRINFVGGVRGMEELEKLVNSGHYQVAFSMYPTSLEQLMAIADAGEVMPPKSTWFEPKLRSGIVLHMFSD